jgi:hypothetical protein
MSKSKPALPSTDNKPKPPAKQDDKYFADLEAARVAVEASKVEQVTPEVQAPESEVKAAVVEAVIKPKQIDGKRPLPTGPRPKVPSADEYNKTLAQAAKAAAEAAAYNGDAEVKESDIRKMINDVVDPIKDPDNNHSKPKGRWEQIKETVGKALNSIKQAFTDLFVPETAKESLSTGSAKQSAKVATAKESSPANSIEQDQNITTSSKAGPADVSRSNLSNLSPKSTPSPGVKENQIGIK